MQPDRETVDAALERICASPDFATAAKMRELLHYLVDATLHGDADRLKGYTIGVDVFGRDENFDPAVDSIVRVQVGRLRKLLDYYYLAHGAEDPLRLDIPKGGNQVSFSAQPVGDERNETSEDQPAQTLAERLRNGRSLKLAGIAAATLIAACAIGLFWWNRPPPATTPTENRLVRQDRITLAVLPLTNMTGKSDQKHIADGFSDELTTEIARNKLISVVSRTTSFQFRKPEDLRRIGRNLGVRYILEGSMQRADDRIHVNIQLIDATEGGHVWAENYDEDVTDLLKAEKKLVSKIAAELRPQLYNAAVRSFEKKPLNELKGWQLFLLATWTPGEAHNSLAWENQRVALAQLALGVDPRLGQAHSVLADKLAYLANVNPPSDTEANRMAAEKHALRALDLAANDADTMFNVSIHYWHAGDIANAMLATGRTLELDPNNALAQFLSIVVPYTCKETPQAVIDHADAFDRNLSPNNPVRWVTLAWIARLYFNNGQFAKAEDAAQRGNQIFRTPDTFYQLATVLNEEGKVAEAVRLVESQYDNWPHLDPWHYADVTIPRRCGSQNRAAFVQAAYDAFADAFTRNSSPRGPTSH